jgi:hypothetical protein
MYTVDGVRYNTAQEAQRARRLKALKSINENTGIRSRLWNFFATKEAKEKARKDYESMM